MLNIRYTNKFKSDYKQALKRGKKEDKLRKVIELLANRIVLPEKYRDHKLTNSKDYENVRECHIEPDWLLIYEIIDDELILNLLRTGSHSDLFW